MPTLDTFINRGVILTLRDARLRDLLPEGRIALGDKVQNRRIGLTWFLDFDIPRVMKRLRQNTSPLLSNSRWLAYAAAGAATSLGGAQSAEAEIHYSGVINDHVRDRGFVPLDHNARLRFNEYNTYQATFTIDGAAVSNAFCGYEGRFGTNYVSRLSQGAVISNCHFLSPPGSFLVLAPYSGGPFFEKGIGFIGVRFNNGAGVQYGWARLRMPGPPYFDMRFSLMDYAWGDPGDQIRAGQTSLAGDMVDAVPDSGSLGLLALGGAGLMAWRKRRGQAIQ
ncbi:MAG: hypothetical protein DME60_09710 [Verrucomicrobia bacterium]|nr:MAG: hypothetical protein DME60_09710 [Verrucomicrobiota bacterium]